MHKIAVTTASFGEFDSKPLEILRTNDFEVALNHYRRKLKGKEVVGLCKDAIGIIAGTEMWDAKIIKQLVKLKVISRCGSGLDNIDCNAAKKRRIKVFNTPDAPVVAVAELAIGLMINLLRKVNQMDTAVKNGKWHKLMGSLLSGKKVGIIGFGRIGRQVAELLRPFHCEIVYADPFVEDGLAGLERVSIEKLLKFSDIISIHAFGKEKIIGKKEFGLIKKGSWIINVSRPSAVDERMLYRYLKNGHISGAALDVFQNEPYNGPLKRLDNVILTPHIGSYAKEARIKMEMGAVKNLLIGLER